MTTFMTAVYFAVTWTVFGFVLWGRDLTHKAELDALNRRVGFLEREIRSDNEY